MYYWNQKRLKKQIYLLLIILNSIAIPLHAQSDTVFCGQVKNVDQEQVDFAHVINRNTEKAVITKEDGSFCIQVSRMDTVMIKTLRYLTDTIIMHDSLLASTEKYIAELTERSYPISEVRIYPYRSYEEFKRAFKNHDPDPVGLNPKKEESVPMLEDDDYLKSPGFILNSPISFLYYQFSDKEKDKRNARKLYEEEKNNRIIEKKYNRDIIKQMTDLKSEKEITEFILFCQFDQSFVIHATEYEILSQIQDCYKRFKQRRRADQ